jgi:hypothetical protein
MERWPPLVYNKALILGFEDRLRSLDGLDNNHVEAYCDDHGQAKQV